MNRLVYCDASATACWSILCSVAASCMSVCPTGLVPHGLEEDTYIPLPTSSACAAPVSDEPDLVRGCNDDDDVPAEIPQTASPVSPPKAEPASGESHNVVAIADTTNGDLECTRGPSVSFAADVVNKTKEVAAPLSELLEIAQRTREKDIDGLIFRFSFDLPDDEVAFNTALMKLAGVTWNESISAFALPQFLSEFEDPEAAVPIFPAPAVMDVMRYIGDIICDLQELGFTLVQDKDKTLAMHLVDPGCKYDPEKTEALPKAIIHLVRDFRPLRLPMSVLLEYWELRCRIVCVHEKRLLDDFISHLANDLEGSNPFPALGRYRAHICREDEYLSPMQLAVGVFDLFMKDVMLVRRVARLRVIQGCLCWIPCRQDEFWYRILPVTEPGEIVRRVAIMRLSFAASFVADWNFDVHPINKSRYPDAEESDLTMAEVKKEGLLFRIALFERPSILNILYGVEEMARRKCVADQDTTSKNDDDSGANENLAIAANTHFDDDDVTKDLLESIPVHRVIG